MSQENVELVRPPTASPRVEHSRPRHVTQSRLEHVVTTRYLPTLEGNGLRSHRLPFRHEHREEHGSVAEDVDLDATGRCRPVEADLERNVTAPENDRSFGRRAHDCHASDCVRVERERHKGDAATGAGTRAGAGDTAGYLLE
jgi:hypothetical protein